MVPDTLPEGFRYQADFLSGAEERELLSHIAGLTLHAFRFQGFTAKRRVASFGFHYSFENYRITPGEPIPEFLVPLRDKSAALIGESASDLVEALVTEYPAGATIGWHRDVAPFQTIIGVSLAGPCTFKLRRGKPRQRQIVTVEIQPRSVYVLSGPARTEWEHHIPATPTVRYSITLRTLAPAWKAKLAS